MEVVVFVGLSVLRDEALHTQVSLFNWSDGTTLPHLWSVRRIEEGRDCAAHATKSPNFDCVHVTSSGSNRLCKTLLQLASRIVRRVCFILK
jgi:hypothetical protein